VVSLGLSVAGASVVIDTVLEAGGQEKVCTPLLGKGVGLFVKGKPVDTLYADKNEDIENLKKASDRFKEFKGLKELTKSCYIDDNSLFFFKDKNTIKSALDDVKYMEKSRLQSYAKDFAKKIEEYSKYNDK
jgi:hypothetical protein